jgi:hypothetical protein
LRYAAAVGEGGTCGGKPCWKAVPGGFRYGNGRDSSSGVASIGLRQTGGSTKIALKGRGANLGGLHMLPLTLPVTVQLLASNGECWSATFNEPQKNGATSFKAVARP